MSFPGSPRFIHGQAPSPVPVHGSRIPVHGGSGESTYNPAVLFTGMGVWFDAADEESLYQDTAATTAATSNTHPVQYWRDKSGNNRHITQGTGGLFPTLDDTSGKNGVKTDGVDDYLVSAATPSWAATSDIFLVVTPDPADTQFILMDRGIGGSRFIGCGHDGSALTINDLPGSTPNPTTYVNGAAFADRDTFHDAMKVSGTPKIVELRDVDFAGMSPMVFGRSHPTFEFSGKYHEILIFPAKSAAERDSLRTYLTSKWGVS
jgi:hypothetical protein